MKYWKEYDYHHYSVTGTRKRCDDTIYTFDIETTSYIIYKGEIYETSKYQELDKKEQEQCEFASNMYIWMMSINEDVYYGRTWEEFHQFIAKIDSNVKEHKIIYVHNLSFEFQYFKSYFKIENVMARKAHKVMKCELKDFNFEFRCSLMMSNCGLKKLPELYNLPVQKMVGDLDYTKLRTNETPLTAEEMGYCKNDCLVVYYYIKYELETYKELTKIPLTSTGHVRNELKDLVRKDYAYKRLVSNSVNTDPLVYNRLVQAFQGGYTHANYLYTDMIIKNVDSWDFTSSYPFCLCCFKYPSTKFKKCQVKKLEDMSKNYAYLMTVTFKNLKSKYYNHFISMSKCSNIVNGKYDNGRVMSADELTITITNIDFMLYLKAYECEYKIEECYCSVLRYLPKQFINFILDKYVMKTKYKGVPEKQLDYQKQKGLFNSLYGMAVTNEIKMDVQYDDIIGWTENDLTNEDIVEMLKQQEKKGFLNFATGVFCTAYARWNLITNIMKLDEYVVYVDTDSIKAREGYNKQVIEDYNKKVIERIKYVSNVLKIPFERFAPKDIKGVERTLGLFDDDGHYEN